MASSIRLDRLNKFLFRPSMFHVRTVRSSVEFEVDTEADLGGGVDVGDDRDLLAAARSIRLLVVGFGCTGVVDGVIAPTELVWLSWLISLND